MGLYDLLKLYRQFHPQLKDSTASTYLYAVRALERHLGRSPKAEDLQEAVLLSFLADRLGRGGGQTVRREAATIFRLWKFAWKRRVTSNDPRDCELPRIKIDREPPIAFTPEELRRVLTSCDQESGYIRGTSVFKAAWWHALVLVLYWSGGRISAVLSLRQGDLDHRTGRLHFAATASKTRKGQIVVVPPEAIQAVEAMHWAGEAIFPKPYQYRWLWTSWKRILRRAGIPADRWHGFHAIRRTTATLLTQAASIEAARLLLGHATQTQTWAYVDPRLMPPPVMRLPHIG